MRSCEGLVDSLLYVIKACVNTSDFDSKVGTPPPQKRLTQQSFFLLFHDFHYSAATILELIPFSFSDKSLLTLFELYAP